MDEQSRRAKAQRSLAGMNLAGAVDLESLKHKPEAPAGQEGGAPAAGGYVVDVDTAGFESMVRMSATYPILLLLWQADDERYFDLASRLAGVVDRMKGQMQLVRMDIATNPQVVQALRVQGAPALYALIGGRPMPIVQGMPTEEELTQIEDQILPQLVSVAQQAGITGTAPYMEKSGDEGAGEGSDSSAASGDSSQPVAAQIPAGHEQAYQLTQDGQYEQAAAAYAKIMESNPHDLVAAREHAKSALLARNGQADLRTVRKAAGDRPDDVQAQLDVADVDMIGGHLDDAFSRLLDFLQGHKGDPETLDAVRQRLLEYFAIPEATDERVRKARMRLATLMY